MPLKNCLLSFYSFGINICGKKGIAFGDST
jgi:hypothetical protein